MNRADRRRLQRTAAKALATSMANGQPLQHPLPESVTLSGGPMNGWVVKPGAPALRPDWCLTWPKSVAAKHDPGQYVADGPRRAKWVPL
jgi:hypothetical protein